MGLYSLVYIMPKYNPDIDWNPEEPKQEYPDAEYVVTEVLSHGGGGVQRYECKNRCGATITLKQKYCRNTFYIRIKDGDSMEQITIEDTPYGASWDWIEMVYRVPDTIVFEDSVEMETDIEDRRMELREERPTYSEKVRSLIAEYSDGNPICVTDLPVPYDDFSIIDRAVLRWVNYATEYSRDSSIPQSNIDEANDAILAYFDGEVSQDEAIDTIQEMRFKSHDDDIDEII